MKPQWSFLLHFCITSPLWEIVNFYSAEQLWDTGVYGVGSPITNNSVNQIIGSYVTPNGHHVFFMPIVPEQLWLCLGKAQAAREFVFEQLEFTAHNSWIQTFSSLISEVIIDIYRSSMQVVISKRQYVRFRRLCRYLKINFQSNLPCGQMGYHKYILVLPCSNRRCLFQNSSTGNLNRGTLLQF